LFGTGAVRNAVTRKVLCSLFCLVCSNGVAVAGAPQFQVIQIEEPVQSRSLSGIVLDPTGATISGVLVEQCEEGWKNCFAQTRTDEDGRFSWRHAGNGKHFLRLSKNGFDPLWITVVVVRSSKTEIRLYLTVAT